MALACWDWHVCVLTLCYQRGRKGKTTAGCITTTWTDSPSLSPFLPQQHRSVTSAMGEHATTDWFHPINLVHAATHSTIQHTHTALEASHRSTCRNAVRSVTRLAVAVASRFGLCVRSRALCMISTANCCSNSTVRHYKQMTSQETRTAVSDQRCQMIARGDSGNAPSSQVTPTPLMRSGPRIVGCGRQPSCTHYTMYGPLRPPNVLWQSGRDSALFMHKGSLCIGGAPTCPSPDRWHSDSESSKSGHSPTTTARLTIIYQQQDRPRLWKFTTRDDHIHGRPSLASML